MLISSNEDRSAPESTSLAETTARPTIAVPGVQSVAMPVQAHNDEASIVPLIHAFRRQWVLGTILGTALAVPAAFVMWTLQEPKFTSSAYLRVASRDFQIMYQTADANQRNDFHTYKNTQRQLMLSPFVLSKALSSPALAAIPELNAKPDPIQWLEQNLVVMFPENSEIMRVQLADPNPGLAKAVVAAVVDSYMKEVVEAEKNERTRRLDQLERAYSDAEVKVRSKRASLRSLADTLGTSDSETLSLAQQGTMEQFGLLRNELTRVQFEKMKAEGELKFLQENYAARQTAKTNEVTVAAAETEGEAESAKIQLLTIELDRLAENDRKTLEMEAERDRLQKSIAVVEQRVTGESASKILVEKKAALADVEKRLAARRDELKLRIPTSVVAAAAERVEPGLQELADAELRVKVLTRQYDQLAMETKEIEKEAQKYGRSSIDVEMMKSEITSLDAIVSQVASEVEKTKIELNSASRVELLNEATNASKGSSKSRVMTTAFSGAAAFGFPLLLLMIRDLRKRRVDSSSSISESIGVEVLGTLPTIPQRMIGRMHGSSKSARHWQWRMMEAINAVAATVTRHARLSNSKVYMISSAGAAEGKSTLASYLSVSLAESGHRTLVIDFDLRRPTLHSTFEVSLSPGVSDVLQNEADLTTAIINTQTPNLDLLPAGKWKGNILSGSRSGAIKELIAAAREDYDIVIVDGSPALAAVDARLIGQFTDGAILSARRDVSQMPRVKAACDTLRSHGIKILGSVVTGCDSDVYYDPDYVPEI